MGLGELRLRQEPGKTQNETSATLLTNGVLSNALVAVEHGYPLKGILDPTAAVDAVAAAARHVSEGDLAPAEQLLMAQAVALNAMFSDFAHRATVNRGGNFEVMERYLRLSLKAQSQCRATLETLAAVKYPPVFAKQINQAFVAAASPRAGGNERSPNRLLEGERERVDATAADPASHSDLSVEALATVHRAAHGRRKGALRP